MVMFTRKTFDRIKNSASIRSSRDFEFSILSFLLMLILTGIAGGVYLYAGAGDPAEVARGMAAVTLAAVVYAVYRKWGALIPAILLGQVALFSGYLADLPALAPTTPGIEEGLWSVAVLLIIILGPSIQLVQHWDKVVILRLGRFRRVADAGVFFLMPVIDRCAAYIDTRIRVTDFSAEKILTRDTVPVHVDALAFWMIWDARKAVLEVENYLEAVTLSAQTALRDSIGKYSLTTLLSERETLYKEIQSILDAKTNPWGISILSVEFTDIVLPGELENVMSRQAQAEREKEARLYLASAERQIASEFAGAAEAYRGNPEALNLRAMNMVYEGLKSGGSMVLMPSSALDSMNLGSTLGVSAYGKQHGSGHPTSHVAETAISSKNSENTDQMEVPKSGITGPGEES